MNLHAVNTLNNVFSIHRFIRLRRRYFFTKADRLRVRYIAISAFMVSVLFAGVFGSSIYSYNESMYSASVAEDLDAVDSTLSARSVEMALAPLAVPNPNPNASDTEIGDLEAISVLENVEKQEAGPKKEIIRISSGDTVSGALQSRGISGVDAYYAVKAMSKYFDPRKVKPGQAISVELLSEEEGGVTLGSMRMKLDPVKEIVVAREDNGQFASELTEKEILLKLNAAQTSIETSLYGSAARDGIPASVIAEMIRIYSYDVDFQRDIRQGDQVEIFYETYETEDGEFARYGDIVYANLMVGGHKIPVYRFEYDGSVDYYRENGTSLKRTLMMTPVDGARISSGFGMRHHPVLGYNKMHKGVDFAAPTGTPIYAAGDGVIEKLGRNGGYGNYIRIRHNGELKTAYAHLHKFAKGVSNGKRVQQGQVIGYVGTTGRSTGPHLHFEVLRGNKQVNPKSIKSSPGQKLAGDKLQKFRSQISKVQKKYAAASTELKFARNELSQ